MIMTMSSLLGGGTPGGNTGNIDKIDMIMTINRDGR